MSLLRALNKVYLMFFRTRVPYGEENEMFVYPMTLVFIQTIVNALFAQLGLLTSFIWRFEKWCKSHCRESLLVTVINSQFVYWNVKFYCCIKNRIILTNLFNINPWNIIYWDTMSFWCLVCSDHSHNMLWLVILKCQVLPTEVDQLINYQI